jgi:hypothetical protein
VVLTALESMHHKLFCCGVPFSDIPHKSLAISPSAWLDANEVLATVLHAVGVPVVTATSIHLIAYRAQFEQNIPRRKLSTYTNSVYKIFSAAGTSNWASYLKQFDDRMTREHLYDLFGYSNEKDFLDAHPLSDEWTDWLQQFIGFTSNCTWDNDVTWSKRMLQRSNPVSLSLDLKREALSEIKELTELNSHVFKPI